MLTKLLFAAALACLPFAARAEEAPVLAEYYDDSGSLPPEHAWETRVIIRTDGRLSLKYCTGYEKEGPACKARKAKIGADAVSAIREAALESGLAETPAQDSEYPTVGGSATGGAVFLDGQRVSLTSDPAEADAPRVAAVLQAIRAAIPHRFARFLNE